MQAFEKFISGMYLGEIARNVVLSLVDAVPQPLIFSGYASDDLNKHYGLDTAVLSEVEEIWLSGRDENIPSPVPDSANKEQAGPAPSVNRLAKHAPDAAPAPHPLTDLASLEPEDIARLERIRGTLVQRLGLRSEHVSLRDAAAFLWVAGLVADRAARLSATAIAAVLVQTGRAKLGGGYAPEEEETINVGVDGRCATCFSLTGVLMGRRAEAACAIYVA